MPHIFMKGKEALHLCMPFLHDGPYDARPQESFEVSSRDALLLLEGNENIFMLVDEAIQPEGFEPEEQAEEQANMQSKGVSKPAAAGKSKATSKKG